MANYVKSVVKRLPYQGGSIRPNLKKLIGAVKKIGRKASDLRLNKAGTVGTEPIGKRMKDGSMKRYVNVKLGRLGGFDIPVGRSKKASR